MIVPRPLDYCEPGVLQSLNSHVARENQEHLVSRAASLNGKLKKVKVGGVAGGGAGAEKGLAQSQVLVHSQPMPFRC